jgi:hypothetical protein
MAQRANALICFLSFAEAKAMPAQAINDLNNNHF